MQFRPEDIQFMKPEVKDYILHDLLVCLANNRLIDTVSGVWQVNNPIADLLMEAVECDITVKGCYLTPERPKWASLDKSYWNDEGGWEWVVSSVRR